MVCYGPYRGPKCKKLLIGLDSVDRHPAFRSTFAQMSNAAHGNQLVRGERGLCEVRQEEEVLVYFLYREGSLVRSLMGGSELEEIELDLVLFSGGVGGGC